MNKYIALLRGINVSGQKKVKMEDLRAMCEKMSFQKVQTYIQSGNVIFESQETNIATLEKAIHDQMQITFGYDVAVIVRTQAYFQKTIDNNPFLIANKEADIKLLHVTFLGAIPPIELVQKLMATDYGTDEFQIIEDKAYLYFPNGYGCTKLTNNVFEQKLKTAATTRNWNTVLKLTEMMG